MTRAAAVAACGVGACASTYHPRTDPTVKVVFTDMGPAYQRCDEQHLVGLFSTGIGDAVHGDAEAEAQARIAHDRTVGGFGVILAGAVVAGYGAMDAFFSQIPEGAPPGAADRGLTIVAAGVGVMLAAVPLLVSGAAHEADAVNVYNDRARERGATCAGAR